MSDLVTIARGDASRIVEPRQIIARTADEWRTLWALHAGPTATPPAVDFTNRIVAAAFAGEKPTAGYSVEIADGLADGRGVTLIVQEHVPRRDMVVAQIISSPFHIATLPRTDAEVRWSGATTSSRRAEPVEAQIPRTDSSTGLSPRTASTLAYLAGPVSGALILLAESRNGDVRFHAWQSILALGGLGLAVALGYLMAVASLFVWATAVSLIVRVSTALSIALLVVWGICLWKAYAGGRWKLPLAGEWAERMVRKELGN